MTYCQALKGNHCFKCYAALIRHAWLLSLSQSFSHHGHFEYSCYLPSTELSLTAEIINFVNIWPLLRDCMFNLKYFKVFLKPSHFTQMLSKALSHNEREKLPGLDKESHHVCPIIWFAILWLFALDKSVNLTGLEFFHQRRIIGIKLNNEDKDIFESIIQVIS